MTPNIATQRVIEPAAPTGTPADSILDLMARTALLRLHRLTATCPGVEIYAKAEFQNPGGSDKDRAAVAIITDAEHSGRLTPDRTILDATSGNTAIAYAITAAARGYRVKLCVPASVTPERLRTLQAYGAEVLLTSAMEGIDAVMVTSCPDSGARYLTERFWDEEQA